MGNRMEYEKIWSAIQEQVLDENGGSLRDIYVHNTSIQDWQRVLSQIKNRGYDCRAEQKGETVTLDNFDPTSHLLNSDSEHWPHLYIKLGNIQINCHFFWDKEIEFDIEPKEIRGIEDAVLLFEFMKVVSMAATKDCILTYENSPEIEIIRYSVLNGNFEIVVR
jgi:hypothetical protein